MDSRGSYFYNSGNNFKFYGDKSGLKCVWIYIMMNTFQKAVYIDIGGGILKYASTDKTSQQVSSQRFAKQLNIRFLDGKNTDNCNLCPVHCYYFSIECDAYTEDA